MKKFVLAAALGATALSGTAVAQTSAPAPADRPMPPRGGPMMMSDIDRDGIVTRDEAAAAADRRFAEMDTNHDGKISGDERRAMREHRREMRDERREADGRPPRPPRDDDRGPRRGPQREMTQKEFRDRALAMFDRVDTNHDGRIDQQERDAARLLRRARMAGHDGNDGNDAPPPPPPPGEDR
jgi:hypothetical protein